MMHLPQPAWNIDTLHEHTSYATLLPLPLFSITMVASFAVSHHRLNV